MNSQTQQPLLSKNDRSDRNLESPIQLNLFDRVPDTIEERMAEFSQSVRELLRLLLYQNQELKSRLKAEREWAKVLTEMPVGSTLRLLQNQAIFVNVSDREVVISFPSWQVLQRARKEEHLIQFAAQKVWGDRIKVCLQLSKRDR